MTTLELDEIVRPFRANATGIRFENRGAADFSSYQELTSLGVAFAHRLRRLGVAEGEAVGLILMNDKPSVVALLGTWIAGNAAVSIPPAGRGLGADLYRSGFSTVLAQVPCSIVFGPASSSESLAAPIAFHDVAALVAGLEPSTDDPGCPIPDQALVQFTSGSTSLPRGVVLSKGAVAGHLGAVLTALDLNGDEPAVSWLPLHHDMGLIGFLMMPLMVRGPLTLMDPRGFLRNPLGWLEECAAHPGTVTGAPNFGYRMATKALRNGQLTGDLRQVKHCLAGAERISAHTLREFAAAAAPFGFREQSLRPVYGLAEATLGACFSTPGSDLIEGPADTVSVGNALPEMETRIVDPDADGRGRLELRGSWLLDEYITESGRTRPKDAEGWFATSDVAQVADGHLFIVGRRDEVVFCRGANVYAEDLESLSLRVAGEEAFAVAAFKPSADAQCFTVVVELATRRASDPDRMAEEIHSAIVGNLGVDVDGVYVCKPRTVPLTTSGKVRRGACRTLLAEGAWPGRRAVASSRAPRETRAS
jgi:acyl-CoA synthetase (AMP-forming)/AMP-acid ligase II